MKMIEVTLSTGMDAIINVDKIHIFYKSGSGTRIWLRADGDDGYWDVRDNVDDIREAIADLSE